jgi:autotransporter-associated beta strand protein
LPASAVVASLLTVTAARGSNLNGTVTFIPLDTSAYGVNDLNSVGISRDNLATVGNYQYTAYYEYTGSDSSATIMVARRAIGSSTWTRVQTPYSINTTTNGSDSIITDAIDDHDVVAMAVDGNGDMHLSWGMHNIALNYAISNPVNGTTFDPTFTTQTPSNNPNLFAEFTSTGVSQATYPEFYYTPNSSGTPSGNLLFDIRDAASNSGGGSGNGNTYFSIFNASTGFAAPTEALNGGQTSVNGYQNNLVYAHNGTLLYSWTWRETPNYQSNANILFAQSTTNSTTWTQQGGSPAYTLPIIASTVNGGLASQVAQVIESIPQNSSLINTTGMTVDANNNPIIATWWTPNGNASEGVSSTNNPNRQYMLVYYTGTTWKTSQITDRTTDTAFDGTGGDVRDLGRPLVMVDQQGRVLVVTRSDNAMGSFTSSSASGNNIVVYWNTVKGLDSSSPGPWQSIALDTANMGEWEPSMDYNLWASSNTLDLFYEPSGITGQTTGDAQILQWNEQAYFASYVPASLTWDTAPAPALADGSGVWDLAHTNFTDGTANYAWSNNYSTGVTFGAGSGAAGVVTLGANITLETITFNAAGSGNYTIAGGGYSLNFSSGATITANANASISAPMLVTGNLNKLGAGTLSLTGTNSISGQIILGSGQTSGGNVNGALRITSAAAVAGVTQISFDDGSSAYDVFQIDGTYGNITLPGTLSFVLDGAATVAGSNVIESIAGNNVINGTISPTVYGNQYTVQSDAGTLTINSAFSLGTLSTARYLNIDGAGNGNWVGAIGNGTGGGTLGLTKLGGGSWTLSNTETYTGVTNISGGTLTLASGASLASATVNVSSGAILTAYGTMTSSTALLADGTVNFEPGSGGIFNRSIASLTIGSGGQVNVVDAANHSSRTVLVLTSYSMAGSNNAWQGKVDLSNNDLLVHNGSIGILTSQAQAGYGSGSWNGTSGIASTAASADSTHLTAIGVIQNSANGNASGTALYTTFGGIHAVDTDVLVKYTYYGDATLSGTVNGTDYSRIDTAYLNNLMPGKTALTGWFNGDFNYDGSVNGSDYTLMDNAFNTQGAGLTSEVAQVTDQIAAVPQSPGTAAAVPEPAMTGFLILAPMLLGRRRRSRFPL